MDVLLGMLLFSLLALPAAASPPVDLSDFDGKGSAEHVVRGKKKIDPGISEKQMIYVDNQDAANATNPALRQVKFRVAGRDRPGREGRAIAVLNVNQRVKFVKISSDQRWTMVEIIATQQKTWIPTTALISKE